MCELVPVGEDNINAVVNKFREILENDVFNLTKDEDLKMRFRNLCRKIQSRLHSTKTTCVIFDAQNNKTRLVDGLAREVVSLRLQPNVAYAIGPRDSEDLQIAMQENSDSIIELIENVSLGFLEEPLFVLSHEMYNDFLNELRNKTICNPDVIILVLKSPKDLEKEDVQSFLLSVGKEHNDGSFMLVFNDSEADSCTDKDKCRNCFPEDVVTFVDSTKIKFTDRIFKVSTTKHCCTKGFENLRADLNSNTFKSFRNELEVEMSGKRAVERMNENIFKTFSVLNDIQKVFHTKEVKDAINQFDLELKNKFHILSNEINNQESRSVEKLLSSLKMKNKNNANKEISKRFLQIYKTSKNHYGKQLKDLLPKEHNVGGLAKEMFDKILGTKVNNDKIEEWVTIHFKDIDWETHEELYNDEDGLETEDKSEIQRFNESVGKTCKWIFSAGKEALETLNKEFELKTVRNVDELKKAIDKIMKEYKEKIWVNNISKYLRDIKSKMSSKIDDLKVQVNDVLLEIEKIIKKKLNKHIPQKSVGHYLSASAHKLKINSEISKIKYKIKTDLESFPVTDFNKPFFQPFVEKLSTFKEMDKNVNLFDDCIYVFLGTLNDDKFYTVPLDPANNTKINHFTRFWKFVWRKGEKRYIVESELMAEFGLLKEKLENYLDKINKFYQTTVDDILESGQILQINAHSL